MSTIKIAKHQNAVSGIVSFCLRQITVPTNNAAAVAIVIANNPDHDMKAPDRRIAELGLMGPCRNLRAKSDAKETVLFQCVISLRQL